MKWIFVALLLSGCYSGTEQLFLQVNNDCPKNCESKNGKWSGLLKAYPETLKCICYEKSK